MNIGAVLWTAAILAVIPATIAKKRDPEENFFAWWLYGFLFWIVALPHSILFKVRPSGESELPNLYPGVSSTSQEPPELRPVGERIAKVIGMAVVFIIVCIVVRSFLHNVRDDSTSTAAQPTASTENRTSENVSTEKESVIEVSPSKLYADYHRNEVAADSVYRGKRLRVSGTVDSINKNAFDQIYLTFQAFDSFLGVQAVMQPREEAQAGQLSKGDSVSVLCTGGTMVIGIPTLEDCDFTEAPPAERPRSFRPPSYEPEQSQEATANNEPDDAPVSKADALANMYAAARAQARPAYTGHVQTPTVSEDAYEYKFLQVMQSHWTVPSGVPVDTNAEMRVAVLPNGRIFTAVIKEPSAYPALDQSCLDAINQIGQFDAPPTGRTTEISFGCRVK